MITDVERKDTIRFITERRCKEGGYCHYRLEEPNAADTFYALDTLRMLEAPLPDPATEDFLLRMQRADGGYSILYKGDFVLRSLAILERDPAADPRPWLLSIRPVPGDGVRPVESASVFERTLIYLTLCRTLGIAPEKPVCDAVLAFLHVHHHPDGGFGHPCPTLYETCHALVILDCPGMPHESFGSERFIRHCEHPGFGYLNIPGATPSFLEHVAAGVECAILIGTVPRLQKRCETFVRKCRNPNGGYSRSTYGGVSNLENTWHAVRIQILLSQMNAIL